VTRFEVAEPEAFVVRAHAALETLAARPGYVAGRLVRFNGGRNGALTVGWGLLLAGLLAILPAFLPGTLFRLVRDVVSESILPAIGNLVAIGGVGLGILIGAILLMVLGGFFGGRFGNRYHAQIDRTT